MGQIKQRHLPRLTAIVVGEGTCWFSLETNLDKNITVLQELGNDRIIILKVNLSLHNTLFIVAVYLPTSKESINIFKAYLGTLDEIICNLEHDGTVMVVGDFNAHIHCCFQGVNLTPKLELKNEVQDHPFFGGYFNPINLLEFWDKNNPISVSYFNSFSH